MWAVVTDDDADSGRAQTRCQRPPVSPPCASAGFADHPRSKGSESGDQFVSTDGVSPSAPKRASMALRPDAAGPPSHGVNLALIARDITSVLSVAT